MSIPATISRLGSPRFLRTWGWCTWIALGLILAWAWQLRTTDPSYPLADSDSWGWLVAGLRWVGGLGFHEHYEREWLYGAFLAGCLKLTGTFLGIVTIQKLLGILSGVFLYGTWRTWSALFPQNAIWQVPVSIIGLYLTAAQLSEPNQRALEVFIRPEAIMAAVGFAQLLCISLFCKATWVEKNPVKSVVFGALAAPLAWAMFILKPNWALAVPATLIPLAVGLLWSPLSLRFRIAAPAIGCALIGLLLLLPAKLFFIPSSEPRTVLPLTLLTIHAEAIRESFAQRMNDPTDPRADLLREFLPDVDREMAEARQITRYYSRLGFDPDYLMYRSSLPPILLNRHGMDKKELGAFCVDAYTQAWRTHPGLMLKKIWAQGEFYLLPDQGTFTKKRQNLNGMIRDTAEIVPESLGMTFSPPVEKAYQDWRTSMQQLASADVSPIQAPKWVFEFRQKYAPLTPWVMGAFTIALLACLIWPPLFFLRVAAMLTLTFWGASAGNALTVAIVHALDNSRYRVSYGSMYFFAVSAMTIFVAFVMLWCLWLIVQKHVLKNP